jgi:hypothetical protein
MLPTRALRFFGDAVLLRKTTTHCDECAIYCAALALSIVMVSFKVGSVARTDMGRNNNGIANIRL